MTLDYDKYGHCIICGKNMKYTQIVDGKEISRFSDEYCEVEYLLNDNSKMRVAICTSCKPALADTTDTYDMIMEKVVKGWDVETSALVADPEKKDWTPDRKKVHMARYSNLSIKSNIQGVPDDIVTNIKKSKERGHGNHIKD